MNDIAISRLPVFRLGWADLPLVPVRRRLWKSGVALGTGSISCDLHGNNYASGSEDSLYRAADCGSCRH